MDPSLSPSGDPQGDLYDTLVDVTQTYQILAKVGRGSTGKVYHVRHRKNQIAYALKMTYGRKLHIVIEEYKLVRKLDIKPTYYALFFGKYKSKIYLCLLMDYIEGVDLFDLIYSPVFSLPNEEEAIHFMNETIKILKYLHSSDIVHCDIKPENIRVNQDGNVYLIDYDFIKNLKMCKDKVLLSGTPIFFPPESLDDGTVSKTFLKSMDIFALGLTFFEYFNGMLPYLTDIREVYDINMVDDIIREGKMRRCVLPSPRVGYIVDKMLSYDYSLRPVADDIEKMLESIVSQTSTMCM